MSVSTRAPPQVVLSPVLLATRALPQVDLVTDFAHHESFTSSSSVTDATFPHATSTRAPGRGLLLIFLVPQEGASAMFSNAPGGIHVSWPRRALVCELCTVYVWTLVVGGLSVPVTYSLDQVYGIIRCCFFGPSTCPFWYLALQPSSLHLPCLDFGEGRGCGSVGPSEIWPFREGLS